MSEIDDLTPNNDYNEPLIEFFHESLNLIDEIKGHLEGLNEIDKIKYLERWKTDRLQYHSYQTPLSELFHDKNLLKTKEYDPALKWAELELEYLHKLELPGTGAEVPKIKIKWNGTPSQFGYLFTEMIRQGFIEPQLFNGEMSYSGTARLFLDHFDIYNKEGVGTTLGNMEKEINPGKNSLSETKRAKFKIPNLSDLA